MPTGPAASTPAAPQPLPSPLPAPAEAPPIGGVGPELLLAEAIERALGSSPDLRSSLEHLRIADATLARARAEYYPKLAAGEAFVTTNIPGVAFFFEVSQRRLSLSQDFNHPGFINNFSTLIFLQQNLYSGGRRRAEERSAAEERDASAFALAAVNNELVYRVAETYYRLAQARDLVESRTTAAHQVERHLELVRARERAGTAVHSDVLSLEVRLAEANEGLISANHQLELGWMVLENVAGQRFGNRSLPVEVGAAPWSARVGAVEAAIVEALQQRPELRESLSQQRAAAHNIEAARAGKRPSVDFLGNYSTFSINSSSGGNGLFVGLLAQVNLFDGRRTRTQIEQACARLRELEARHERLLLDIELEVRQAYVQLKDAEARLGVASQAIAQAQESLREVEGRYRGQAATLTQLIDGQVALTNARIRRANAAADLEIARAAMERSVGHLATMLAPER